jgi:hypothetical protein
MRPGQAHEDTGKKKKSVVLQKHSVVLAAPHAARKCHTAPRTGSAFLSHRESARRVRDRGGRRPRGSIRRREWAVPAPAPLLPESHVSEPGFIALLSVLVVTE